MNPKNVKVRPDAPPPRWLWPLTLGGVGVVCAVTVAGAVLLALGAADPPVAGPVRWRDPSVVWVGGPELALDVNETVWASSPAEARLPEAAFTLHVRGRLTPGSDPSAAWGVWLRTTDGARVIYAFSGERYTTTRICPGDPPPRIEDCPALRPEWRWMPYNRIHTPGTANTLTLHREPSGDIRLRLNDERLGAAPVAMTGEWGLWARGGRESAAVIAWGPVTLHASP